MSSPARCIFVLSLLSFRLAFSEPAINTLSAAEKAAGWKLLFNGTDLSGWHNFKKDGIGEGWQIKDGCLVCVDPKKAGDIVTKEKFSWFELQLDYNISEGGNSGIMYHVTDAGGKVWATGPEFQLEDNERATDPQRCGWLYGLYQPPNDPKTGKILDTTKPAGEWNHVRLLVSPTLCEHDINGTKYVTYVLGSSDFFERVNRSKFAKMSDFAKSADGWIALQGDHGSVSFRNIKIRPITGQESRSLTGKEFIPTANADASIDLGTSEGVKLVSGEWRYSDTRIIEVDFKSPDKAPNKTYDYEPHAGVANFDDSKWEVLDATTLKKPRSTGKICFNWYRINLTIPVKIRDFQTTGSTVSFETTIDDYAEIWVDGKMPHSLGQSGGTVVKGFNAPNRLIIAENVKPGQHIQLAVFGINGPLSVAPTNYIFMRTNPRLDFFKAP